MRLGRFEYVEAIPILPFFKAPNVYSPTAGNVGRFRTLP